MNREINFTDQYTQVILEEYIQPRREWEPKARPIYYVSSKRGATARCFRSYKKALEYAMERVACGS